MAVQYGPWIAFNPGDTPPALDVKVQAQAVDQTRKDAMDEDPWPAHRFHWAGVSDYRVVKQPVRGEVVYDGTLRTFYSLHSGLTANAYDHETDHCHVTFTTADGLLIPGTYTGPDGATIKIEVL